MQQAIYENNRGEVGDRFNIACKTDQCILWMDAREISLKQFNSNYSEISWPILINDKGFTARLDINLRAEGKIRLNISLTSHIDGKVFSPEQNLGCDQIESSPNPSLSTSESCLFELLEGSEKPISYAPSLHLFQKSSGLTLSFQGQTAKKLFEEYVGVINRLYHEDDIDKNEGYITITDNFVCLERVASENPMENQYRCHIKFQKQFLSSLGRYISTPVVKNNNVTTVSNNLRFRSGIFNSVELNRFNFRSGFITDYKGFCGFEYFETFECSMTEKHIESINTWNLLGSPGGVAVGWGNLPSTFEPIELIEP